MSLESSVFCAVLKTVLFCRAYETQEAQLSLTNHLTLVPADVNISLTRNAMKRSFPCCSVKSCSLVNDCDLLAGFSDFYLPLSHLMPSIFSSYRVHIWHGKTRMAGLQSGIGRMMINSVVWVEYIDVTDTQMASSL